MSKPYDNLGQLQKVELREIWESESSDFTPWLARPDNLRLLGDSLGLDLELQACEEAVGVYYADILCKNSATDSYVLIENQIEKTDHSHLGQLITYAAGLRASAVVWIAARFTEEHRAALDWLNESTAENINFFGLEIELWKIGKSEIAPKFNVACKPNDWSKTIGHGVAPTSDREITDRKRLQHEYWIAFAEFLIANNSTIRPNTPRPQSWMNMSLGKAGTCLVAIASFWDSEKECYEHHEIRAEVHLNNSFSKIYFEQLFKQKSQIEREMGEPLVGTILLTHRSAESIFASL